ncbi:MAG: hypothetical protein Q9214_001040 [Letrouitia sp. 1 TL-2023]
MAAMEQDLNQYFVVPGASELPLDISGELQSICRLHSVTPQELSFKWDAYKMKMDTEQTQLDLPTARAFKQDLQEILERESRSKVHMKNADKRGAFATPRNLGKGGGAFDMITPMQRSTGDGKRKAAFETPSVKKTSRAKGMSSPTDGRTDATSFADRQNPGQIIETLNDQLPVQEPPIAPPADARIKVTANSDLKKFFYKPMAMHLSEASEVLDDRIDEFQLLIQKYHKLEDSEFGSAASQATNEIIAVGRIASDTLEGKLNAASLVLETSRRTGAGLRVPLKVESISQEFFPGQIVALRGTNASGEFFSVTEVLEVPLLDPAASMPSTLEAINQRLGVSEDSDFDNPSKALNILISAGPYTADDNLGFEPLHVLCQKAEETVADALILIGPLFDVEHPLLASGDMDLPDDPSIQPDKATLTDAFRVLVGKLLQRLAQAVPSITIVCVPSVRDAVNKHVSWPQEPFARKELGLPKQAKMVSNPVTVSLNEIMVGVSATDVLYELRREEVVVGRPKEGNILARLPKHLIQQRHFCPLYPPVSRTLLAKTGTEEGVATGMPLDTSYLKLGEWLDARPDMLITPSALAPFAKVVESVLVINPGPLSKRKGAGTYAQVTVYPRQLTEEELSRNTVVVGHNLFERARVDILRI